MSNLLPEKNKEENRTKFFYRKLTILISMFTVLVLISCVLLLAAYIYFSFEGAGYREKSKTLAELSASDQRLIKKVQELDKKMKILSPPSEAIAPSAVVEFVARHKGEGVSIHHLALECRSETEICQGAILGRASNRQALLDYVSKLKQSRLFKSVQSPINNLISDRDSQFNLKVETVPIRKLAN